MYRWHPAAALPRHPRHPRGNAIVAQFSELLARLSEGINVLPRRSIPTDLSGQHLCDTVFRRDR